MIPSEIDAERFKYCGGRAPRRRARLQRPANSPIPNIEWHAQRPTSRQKPFRMVPLNRTLIHQANTHRAAIEMDTMPLIVLAWLAMIAGAVYVFFA